MTALTLRVNKTTVDSSYVAAPANFETVETGDVLIFSAGSSVVIDGAAIPNQTELNKAATLLDPLVATVVAHYFLADLSVNLLKEVHLAGNADKRYAFCASFDGATASEPQLEAWDDDNFATYVLGCLGSGTPNSSWYKAVCTTLASPGATWLGTPLAGSGAANSVLLNNGNGALSGAGDLYFNLHVKIPAAYSTPGQYLPVLLITFTTN
jgi:hypothetical protein